MVCRAYGCRAAQRVVQWRKKGVIGVKRSLISCAALAAVCLSLLSGCRSGPAPTLTPSPPPELTLDEGAVPADFSRMDFWNGGVMDELGCRDGRSADLTRQALPGGLDQLLLITFDSRTIWPDALPAGFDPAEIMQANKNPGLGVRALHESGVTGEGVNLGIIDQSLLLDHVEYKDNVRYYRQLWEGENGASMHGAAVASIAVGRSVGVAPGANLYYVSHRFAGPGEDKNSILPYIEALNTLLDLNDSLPEVYKLDAISISRGFGPDDADWDGMKAALDRAEAAGIFVITTSIEYTHGMPIAGAARVPLSDCDDPGNTRPGLFYADYFYERPYSFADTLFVPMDFRATASPTGAEDYTNYTAEGLSWAVPYLAGAYCLAKQVAPELTPQAFWDAAMSTADRVSFDHGGQSYTLEHVINPAGIVEAVRTR